MDFIIIFVLMVLMFLAGVSTWSLHTKGVESAVREERRKTERWRVLAESLRVELAKNTSDSVLEGLSSDAYEPLNFGEQEELEFRQNGGFVRKSTKSF